MMKEKTYRSTPEYRDVVPDTESRQDDVAEKIRSFAETPAEARYREMEPSSPEIVARALRIHDMGKTLGLSSDAFPTPNGSIVVEFYRPPYSLAVTCRPDSSFDVEFEKGIGFDVEFIKAETVMRERDIARNLQDLAFGIGWNLPESSTHSGIMLGRSAGSEVTVLRITRTPFHWSIYNASET